MPNVTQLDHVNMTVANLAASVAWYGRVFGFEVVEDGVQDTGPWAILKAGEAMLALYEVPDRAFEDRFALGDRHLHTVAHFALRITDGPAWEATVAANALPIRYGGPIRWPHSTSWYLGDPTGYEIEVALWNDDEIAFDATG